ncbi:MAG: DUF5723 family protein [Bacteroidetes bacterium]|nr:DUF5723 family protein [Bacteroidota bacterium]
MDSLGFSINNTKFVYDLTHVRNPGFGLDVGAQYKLTDQIILGASVTDLGFISWSANTRNYVSNKTKHSYTFEGIDINEFFEHDTISLGKQFEKVLDSLKNNLGFITTYKHYNSPLLTRLNFTGQFDASERDHFGVLFRMELATKRTKPTLCVQYNHEFGKILNVMTGYSLTTGNYLNLGLGFSLKLGAFQLYMITDNAYAYLVPKDFKSTNFQFGINLCFGDRRFE